MATYSCGLNRHVKDKEVGVDFIRPFDILLNFKALQENPNDEMVNKEKGRPNKKPERPVLSDFLNKVRTYYEQKFCIQIEKPGRK